VTGAPASVPGIRTDSHQVWRLSKHVLGIHPVRRAAWARWCARLGHALPDGIHEHEVDKEVLRRDELIEAFRMAEMRVTLVSAS
jgi:hypothetical protein